MKTWLITGCSSGLGRGIAKAVLAKGDQAIVTARDVEKIRDITEPFPKSSVAVPLDITDTASIKQAVANGKARFGKIDVLVNNAGYGYRAGIEESEPEAVRQLFRTNLFGPAELMNAVLPEMRERKSGTIINISSIGAVRAAIGNGFYSASKAALELISDALNKEVKPLGIRVLIVEPGAFRTNFYKSLQGTQKVITDYAETAGKWHVDKMELRSDQPGNPDVAGKIIVETAERADCPERLLLGSDAVKIAETELNDRLTELKNWEAVSKSTDYR